MSVRSLRARLDRLTAGPDRRSDLAQYAYLMRLVCEGDPEAIAAIAAGPREGEEPSPWRDLYMRIMSPEVGR